MPRQLIQSKLFTPIGPYSHAVRIGSQIFISGTPGIDPATGHIAGTDAYHQARQALSNIRDMLKSANATLDDIGHVQINLVNVNDFAEMNRAYAEFFSDPYPARTVIGIAALPKPGVLLTMNAVAVAES